MRERVGGLIFIGFLYFLLDLFTYFGLKPLFEGRWLRVYQIIYWVISLFTYYSLFRLVKTMETGSLFRDTSYNFYLGIFVTALVTKLVFLLILFLQDIGRMVVGMISYVSELLGGDQLVKGGMPSRRNFMRLIAAGVASIPLTTMLYGITKGKYRYTVNKVQLSFKDLPKAFDGFRIVQISDIHSGSLDSIEEVTRGVEMVNAQNPDLVLFTGDLAVLGNHDYYGVPRHGGEVAQRGYWQDFFAKYEQMNWRLLNNENFRIEKEGDYLQLLGVENWGAGPWFPKRGDLNRCLTNCKEDDFCVLMSHDPTHWDEKVLPHKKHIHLTLSGHTHGMQFGINLPNFKWSPAQYRYPRWMGLYQEKGQYLYVNRGFGFLAFPGRVGMWPEITVIELAREV